MNSLGTIAVTLVVLIATASYGQSESDTLSHSSPDSTRSIGDDIETAQERITALRTSVVKKIDSLNGLSDPNKLLLARLDSFKGGLDSLQNRINERVASGSTELSKVEDKVSKKLDATEKAVNGKLEMFAKNGADVKAINLDLPKAGIPDNIDLSKNLDVANKLPGDITSKLQTPDLQLPELQGKVGSMPSLDRVEDIQNSAGEITEVTNKVTGLSDKVGSLKVDDASQIEQQIESKVSSMDEFKDLEASKLPMKDYSEIAKQLSDDPHMARELALNKAKEGAASHFAGHSKELKAGMDQLSAMKKKYKAMGTTVDMFKRPSDPIREKPFIERLYPGIDLQVRSAANTWITFTPNFAYRLRLRWTIGLGWNERKSLNFKNWKWIAEEHAFGPQVYGEYMVARNLAARAEVDYLNALLPSDVGRAWRLSYYVGLRKMFSISKKLIGSVQLLYNLDNLDEHLFATQRLTIKTGIQLRLKRRQ